MGHRLLSLIRRAGGARPDAELLAAVHDHAAFAELVARHGPMVWGVCRNMLGEQDAEDAFQATFLVLLRSTLRDAAALGAWLHGVAVRVSLAARRQAGRRRVREQSAAARESVALQPDDWADTMAVVHGEIERLPDAERSAFVLCALEGLTQAETATRLGRTPGAVAGQVTRAKKRLVERLTRRGVVPGLAALGTVAVPAAVAARANHLPTSAAPPAVLRLAKGASAMTAPHAKFLALVVGIAASVGAWAATAEQPARVESPAQPPPAAQVAATDWPMGGRSGDRNPVSPEKVAPTAWQIPFEDKKAKNIKWSTRVGSRAMGGPVVSGGLVWVGTNNVSPNHDTPDFAVLACLRESDGKVLTRYLSPRRGAGVGQDWAEQPLGGSPLAEGDRLWFCTNRREVVCLDVGPVRRGTGEPRTVWKIDMVKELNVHSRPLIFPANDSLGSLAAYKDWVFVPAGNGTTENGLGVPEPGAPSLVCLRKDTGKVVWSDNSPGRNLMYGHSASPLVIEIGGRGLVIHPQGDGWVRAFDAETGKQVWKFDCNRVGAKGVRALDPKGQRAYVLATPVYADGRVYFGTGTHPDISGTDAGRLFCIDPTKTGDVSPETDDGTGKGRKNPNSAVAWEYDNADERTGFHLTLSSVAVHDGLLYACDFYGLVHCLDAKSGARHWWHDVKSHAYGHPLVAGGKVYVGTEDGDVVVFAAGKTKQILAKNEMPGGATASPVFANGVLYVLVDGHLHAVADDGAAK